MKLYEELKARGLVAQVTNEEIIREMINEGKATFYIGYDCTADSLTAGHFMTLTLMKRLQQAGNKPIALIGGGTTMIGDPTDKTEMRKMLTREQIDYNAACFKKQMERFIEFGEGKARMVNNADWLMDLNYVELLREVGVHFSVNNMLRAECYKQRMEKGLTFLEFNYMIMQSYDFYHLFKTYGCNMQFGGDDQWSNMLGGTELIRRKLGQDAHCMTITLLTDSQGKKMGKTAGNAVWLLSDSEEELDAIGARLDLLHKLKRKYGASCEEMLAFLARAKDALDEILFADEKLKQAEKALTAAETQANKLALALRALRKSAARSLEIHICEELSALNMPKVRFVCEFTEAPLGPDGLDSLRFLMSANVGEALKPLSRVASGGELARIMLAMKNVMAEHETVSTLIFDEVDAGVSGRAAQKVAEKLRSVAQGRQVLCVTHLPQLAALAEHHLLISKSERQGRTYTEVTVLDRPGRIDELARMIGGTEITETTRKSAAEMLGG